MKKTISWIGFALLQIVFWVLLFTVGPNHKVLEIVIAIVSLVLLLVAISDASDDVIKFVMIIAVIVDFAAFFIVRKNLYAGVLIVDYPTQTKLEWINVNRCYINNQSDTIVLEKGMFYIDNRTPKNLKVYNVNYSNRSYGESYGYEEIIRSNTTQKVSHRPTYLFTSPPSAVQSSRGSAVRYVLTYE